MKVKLPTLNQFRGLWETICRIKTVTRDTVQSLIDDGSFVSLVEKRRDEFVNRKIHTIDLGASPRLPFDGAEVVKHEGSEVVAIELRSDDNLYINGKKVVLHLSERQKGDKRIGGHELRVELENGEQVLLNSNVLDHLCDHPELFPEHWKKDENGDTRFIFFWNSIFRDPSSGLLYVRYLCWHVGELYRHYHWLDDGWSRQDPSASVAI